MYLSRLESATGACIWSQDVGGSVLATPVLVNTEGEKIEMFAILLNKSPLSCSEVVIATLRGCLHKLDLASGRLVWTQELGFPVFASPLLLPDHRLLVATVEGALLTLDIVTGTVVTKLSTPGPVFGSPVMADDGSVLLGCQDGSVLRVIPQDGLEVAWRTEAGSGVVASPDLLDCGQVLVCCNTRGTVQLIGKERGNIIYSSEPFPGEIFSSPLTYEVN